ncbi:unnamed protein product [Leuciscus chuanchicus]
MEVSGEPDPPSQTFHDAQTQWSDPAMEDHTYSKGPTITCAMTTVPSSERSLSVADVVLKDNTDCLLYTGIPLLKFKTLVSCLQRFAPTTSALSAEDQILLTLMKLRQNFVIADLARRFKMSTGQGLGTRGQTSDHLGGDVLTVCRGLL